MNLEHFTDDDIEVLDTGQCVDCNESFEHLQRIHRTSDGYVCDTCFARRDA